MAETVVEVDAVVGLVETTEVTLAAGEKEAAVPAGRIRPFARGGSGGGPFSEGNGMRGRSFRRAGRLGLSAEPQPPFVLLNDAISLAESSTTPVPHSMIAQFTVCQLTSSRQ